MRTSDLLWWRSALRSRRLWCSHQAGGRRRLPLFELSELGRMHRREEGRQLEGLSGSGETHTLHELQAPLAVPPTSLSPSQGLCTGTRQRLPISHAGPAARTLTFYLFVTRFAGSVFTWWTQLCWHPPDLPGVTKYARLPPCLQDEEVGAPPREAPTPISGAALGREDPHFCA